MPRSTRTPLTPAKRQQLRRLPRRGLSELEASFLITPQRHRLSEAECREANRLLRRLEIRRPLAPGPGHSARYALRVAGVISAIRRKVVGNSRWGRRQLATQGGRVLALHGLHHLRTISPLGRQAAQAARERTRAQAHWERTGEPLPLGVSPSETSEQRHLRTINALWEEAQWLAQRDRYHW
jgi:hypothetical protein